ncbi:MAG: LysR family transcriptional regulator [Pseudomonadota bacterium]
MIGRLSDIDLRLLRVFAAVVDAGGFSLATAKLNVAESTISQHMTDLEKRLGMRLCDRGRGGFRLTKNGEHVYRLTIDLLTEIERYRDQVASVRSEVSGTLRLGLPDGIITHRACGLQYAIATYLSQYPEINLEVEMATPRALEKAVLEGRLHLAVAPEHRRVAGLNFRPLFAERNALFCGHDHPLFRLADADIEDSLLTGAGRIARGYLDRFDEHFFPDPDYRATVHQIEAAALLILSGSCIGFLPEHFAAYYVASGQMRAIRPEHYTFESAFGSISKPGLAQDPRIANLIALLETQSRDATA